MTSYSHNPQVAPVYPKWNTNDFSFNQLNRPSDIHQNYVSRGQGYQGLQSPDHDHHVQGILKSSNHTGQNMGKNVWFKNHENHMTDRFLNF